MPDYPIEGVATSTTGFAGPTRYGPVEHPGGPSAVNPRVVSSFVEFERVYGGATDIRSPYVAQAARTFFENGGTRLYVSRVFASRLDSHRVDHGVASYSIPVSGARATWRARWPGSYGNASVVVRAERTSLGGRVVPLHRGALVEITSAGRPVDDGESPARANLAVSAIGRDGRQTFTRHGAEFTPNPTDVIRHLTLTATVTTDDNRMVSYSGLETDPEASTFIGTILRLDDPQDPDAVVYFDFDPSKAAGPDVAANLMLALLEHSTITLTGGHDGTVPTGMDLAKGLTAFEAIDEIAIVALPDAGALTPDEGETATAA
ncbi:MAG TPA: hypothetical protein VLV86_12995, partial [Vicinamibacterales bacterium]|nr:hypothetical protein [Vicinamibacterales bacterium]